MDFKGKTIGFEGLSAQDQAILTQSLILHYKGVSITDDPDQADYTITQGDLGDIPLRLGAVLDRIESQLSQSFQYDTVITYGSYFLNPRSLEFAMPDKTVLLTETERDILLVLFHAVETGCSRADLLKKIWGYDDTINTHTLDTHIHRLRKKIERDPASPRILVSIGGGYRLDCYSRLPLK